MVGESPCIINEVCRIYLLCLLYWFSVFYKPKNNRNKTFQIDYNIVMTALALNLIFALYRHRCTLVRVPRSSDKEYDHQHTINCNKLLIILPIIFQIYYRFENVDCTTTVRNESCIKQCFIFLCAFAGNLQIFVDTPAFGSVKTTTIIYFNNYRRFYRFVRTAITGFVPLESAAALRLAKRRVNYAKKRVFSVDHHT